MVDEKEPKEPGELTQEEVDSSPAESVSEQEALSEEQEALSEEETLSEQNPLSEEASESADESQTTETQPEPQVIKKGGAIAWLALVVALLVGGGVAYLYYELVHLDPGGELRAELDSQRQVTASLNSEISQQLSEYQSAQDQNLSSALQEQTKALEEIESRTTKTLQEALQAAPPSQREWKLAEAEYLMRIANHRVLMEQDSDGALVLLAGADGIIAELDDFSLHTVRARLADEMISLKQVPRDNLQDIYLRLESLKSEFAGLKPLTPEYQGAVEVPDESQTVWQQIADATKDFVRVRSFSDGQVAKPLVAPEEEAFVHQHLQLSLAQAQLSALKREQDVYEFALQNARRYLNDYMDLSGREALLAELDELSAFVLDRPLPDISGSLNELLTATGAL